LVLKDGFMDLMCRITASVVIAGSLTLAAFQADWDWATDVLLDTYHLPAFYGRERVRQATLAQQHEVMQRRLARKRQIAVEVLGGRLSLQAAADQFWEISKDAPYPWDIYKEIYPDWSRQARCAHYVIDDIEGMLAEPGTSHSIAEVLRAQVAAWPDH
jgi:hypothetical protein